jgi:putative membrane protein
MVSAEDALATNPSSAVGFVTRAAVSDLFEVEASRLAVARAKDERVRAFAQDMIAAHTQTSAELKTAVDKLEKSIIVPTELDSAHAAMLDVLRNVSEDAFDALYLDQQVQVHGQAQELMRGYIANGDTETLRAFAERTKPAIDAHASRARALAGGNAAADAPPRAQGGAAIPGDAERSGAR